MDEDRADDDDESDEDGINSDSQSNKNGNHNNDVSDISSELKAIQLQNDYNPNKTGKTMQQIFLEKPPNNKIVLLLEKLLKSFLQNQILMKLVY
jgi:hypothetical protein